jgi:hypothetical protein
MTSDARGHVRKFLAPWNSFAAHHLLAFERLIRIDKGIHLLRVANEHRRYQSDERSNQQQQRNGEIPHLVVL